MKAFLLDIDGTTLLGPDPLPGAVAFVRWLRETGTPHLWLTNNTSRSRQGWLDRLAGAGLEPRPEELYTAGDATIDRLRVETPGPRVYLLGTRELAGDFRSAGIVLAGPDEANMVVLGYDTELTYEKLKNAALLLRAGARYVATHPDVNCPTPDGPIPDVGSFIALLETSCGRRPQVVGKPHATMVDGALSRLGVVAKDTVMVGDRIETDMRMAQDAGLASFLLLSGVASREDLDTTEVRPTKVFASLAEVHAYVRGATP